MAQRKHYLDNLRALCILLLFPFHVFMIYNNWGETFYVHGAPLLVPSAVNRFLWLWMMPLLFVISGISSRYALQKRSPRAFAKERVQKLLLPLLSGMLLLLPLQAYIGALSKNKPASYWDYFTKVSDFSGYDGGFTPGHLWFILFLFVISMLSLPLLLLYSKKGKGRFGANIPLALLPLLGVFPLLGNMLFDISGKSPTEYLALFLLGYFVLSHDAVQEKLDKYRFLLLALATAFAAFTFTFQDFLFEEAAWLAVLAVLGLGRHYLNFRGRAAGYLSKSSFGIYMFHQSWIIILGYFILQATANYWLQIPLILAGSVILTYLTYELARRTAPLRWLFGLKK